MERQASANRFAFAGVGWMSYPTRGSMMYRSLPCGGAGTAIGAGAGAQLDSTATSKNIDVFFTSVAQVAASRPQTFLGRRQPRSVARFLPGAAGSSCPWHPLAAALHVP